MNIKAVSDAEVLLLHKDDLQKLYQKDVYWQEFGRKMTEVIYLGAKKENRRVVILLAGNTV
ncbi:hypothetical protein KUH03_42190 [Sphingobacterium sp. E70]|uniref:hypothetical protein n=1 Tax=Sphingobacterium sp. E70 TaxID=2853439 RepID=UPI00211C78EF|nr:hypothetical protein [Sphingobacterium sp. E70]ULT25327.1 hypothetical protein KUH03_42190 [Sphingobacterium sp. E70]